MLPLTSGVVLPGTVPESVRDAIRFHLVGTVEEALAVTLEPTAPEKEVGDADGGHGALLAA